MSHTLVPTYFIKVDLATNVIFFLVTLFVATVAYRHYRFAKREHHLLFSTGFLLISLAHLVLLTTDILVLTGPPTFTVNALLAIADMVTIASILYAISFLSGLVLLLIIYLDIKDHAVRLLLTIMALFGVLASNNLRSMFYLLVAVLLLFILYRLVLNALTLEKTRAWIVVAAFTFIFIGEIMLSLIFLSEGFHIAADIATLGGYLLLLGSQVRTRRGAVSRCSTTCSRRSRRKAGRSSRRISSTRRTSRTMRSSGMSRSSLTAGSSSSARRKEGRSTRSRIKATTFSPNTSSSGSSRNRSVSEAVTCEIRAGFFY